MEYFQFLWLRGAREWCVEDFQILLLGLAAWGWGVVGGVFSDFVAATGWGVVGEVFSDFVADIG